LLNLKIHQCTVFEYYEEPLCIVMTIHK